jgi:hypothetical protein
MTDEPIFSNDEPPPGVILWFKLYSGFLSFLYLLCAGASLIFLLVDPVELEMDPVAAKLVGVGLLVVGLALFVACLLPLLLPRKPWVWIYDLVIICIGFTGCTWPVCIPLIIYWLKPETKRYFGKR